MKLTRSSLKTLIEEEVEKSMLGTNIDSAVGELRRATRKLKSQSDELRDHLLKQGVEFHTGLSRLAAKLKEVSMSYEDALDLLKDK
tara:strand:- start:6865 stop:7122 length:258 start_codon:yes stop_codon:yes gene_type:complete